MLKKTLLCLFSLFVFAGCGKKDIEILMQDFTLDKNHTIFEKVIHIFNKYESTNNKGDTLRKWIDSRITEIIGYLNTFHGNIVYNSHNIESLIQVFYGKKAKFQYRISKEVYLNIQNKS